MHTTSPPAADPVLPARRPRDGLTTAVRGVLAALTLAGLMLAGCRGESPAPLAETPDQIVYRFQDASVPPEFHRSRRITVTPTAIRIVVDSYGDVISDRTVSIDQAAFDRIVAALETHGLRGLDRRRGPDLSGATGGTGESLTVSAGDRELFAGRLEHVGGETAGTLGGDLDAFLDELGSIINEADATDHNEDSEENEDSEDAPQRPAPADDAEPSPAG